MRLLPQYLVAVLKKNICLESTYDFVMKRQNQIAVQDAAAVLREVLAVTLADLPVSNEMFAAACEEAAAKANAAFLAASMNYQKHNAEIQPLLEAAMCQVLEEFKGKNLEASDAKCKDVITSLFGPVSALAATFLKSGGYTELTSKLNGILDSYNRLSPDELGPAKEGVLENFMQDQVIQT